MELLVRAEPQAVVIGPESLPEEIIQNVRMILTTPKGSVPLDRDFGLDFTVVDKPTPHALNQIAYEVIQQVNKYEPRARVIGVSWPSAENEAMDGKLAPEVKIDIPEAAL